MLPPVLVPASSTDNVISAMEDNDRTSKSTESSNNSKQSSYADLVSLSIFKFLISVEADNATPNLSSVMFTEMWATLRVSLASITPGKFFSEDRQSSGYRVSRQDSRITLVVPWLGKGSLRGCLMDFAAATIPQAAATMRRAPVRKRIRRQARVRVGGFEVLSGFGSVIRVEAVWFRRP